MGWKFRKFPRPFTGSNGVKWRHTPKIIDATIIVSIVASETVLPGVNGAQKTKNFSETHHALSLVLFCILEGRIVALLYELRTLRVLLERWTGFHELSVAITSFLIYLVSKTSQNPFIERQCRSRTEEWEEGAYFLIQLRMQPISVLEHLKLFEFVFLCLFAFKHRQVCPFLHLRQVVKVVLLVLCVAISQLTLQVPKTVCKK